jgi:serine/threonine-protein kinase
MNPPPPDTGRPPRRPLILLVLALAAAALGTYQWIELIQIRTGGAAPFCSVSATVNCASVWNSSLATAIHDYSGIPPAGWGILWGVIVLLLDIELMLRLRKGQAGGNAVLALRLTAAAGAAVALALLGYSIAIGVICPTCFLFYLLVAAIAFIAFRLPRGEAASWSSALLHSGGLLLICFALLLYPGRHTPSFNADLDTLESAASNAKPGEDALTKFLLSLPPQAQQLVSDSRALYRAAPLIDRPVDSNRLIYGNINAPVHLIDWIDVRCPHCKHLEEALDQIRRTTPSSSWSEEGRHFPLDSECNPNVEHSDGTHVACLAAKVLICLGGSQRGTRTRTTLFEKQGHIDSDDIWGIAAPSDIQRRELESCVNSPATEDLLQGDIDYAMQHHIQGTPLLVINGRQAPAYPPFIYAMIIARGDSDAKGFKVLPPPRDQILDR